MSDMKFVDGLFVNPPHQNAPDFVKMKISINPEFKKWLNAQIEGEVINIDVKESKAGKWYCSVDDWKPDPTKSSNNTTGTTSSAPDEDFDDDIPF
jgi:hypothetical protein